MKVEVVEAVRQAVQRKVSNVLREYVQKELDADFVQPALLLPVKKEVAVESNLEIRGG